MAPGVTGIPSDDSTDPPSCQDTMDDRRNAISRALNMPGWIVTPEMVVAEAAERLPSEQRVWIWRTIERLIKGKKKAQRAGYVTGPLTRSTLVRLTPRWKFASIAVDWSNSRNSPLVACNVKIRPNENVAQHLLRSGAVVSQGSVRIHRHRCPSAPCATDPRCLQ